MPTSGENEFWQRYRRDGSGPAFEAVAASVRPLAASICRGLLRSEPDVDDAVQETLLRLVRHRHEIHGSPAAWVAATARNVSLDRLRRRIRQRNRERALGGEGRARRGTLDSMSLAVRVEALRGRLPKAVAALDEADRALLHERFVARQPLRALAVRAGVDASTLSRRVSAMLDRLTEIARKLGAFDADAVTIAACFGDARRLEMDLGCPVGDGLRMAVDWPALLDRASAAQPGLLPGWSRQLRVGFFTSWASATRVTHDGFSVPVDLQMSLSRWLPHGPVQPVAVIEPRSSGHGLIERAVRDYELFGGVIEITDAEGLGTLDVLMIGNDFFLSAAGARAVRSAVESGMGLNSGKFLGMLSLEPDNPDLMALSLSATPVEPMHTEPHNVQTPLEIRGRHPAFPALRPGLGRSLSCGAIFVPNDQAKVVLARRLVDVRGGARLHPTLDELPELVCGHLGRGRVISNRSIDSDWFKHLLAASPEQGLLDALRWLAEPKRGAQAVAP